MISEGVGTGQSKVRLYFTLPAQAAISHASDFEVSVVFPPSRLPDVRTSTYCKRMGFSPDTVGGARLRIDTKTVS